jgi:hypothetical protein
MSHRPDLRPTTYLKTKTAWCVWCGECFDTNHTNARTCTPRCRSRLAAFRARTGFDPEECVGNVTAEQAFDALVKRLLEEEGKRRAFVDAVKTGGAAKLFEVAKQKQPPTTTTKKRA